MRLIRKEEISVLEAKYTYSERMNISKNIENIMGTMLKEQGFEYEKHVGVWAYSRHKGEIKQDIFFLRHRFFKGKIKAVFCTNAYGQGMYEFARFVPNIGTYQEFWEYKNEEELRQILEQFKEWIIKYGLSFLDEISEPTTEVRPKPETNLYLYQNHKEIYERYQKEWQLTDGKETIFTLREKLTEIYNKDFAEIEQTLIEYAAVYGYAMCIDGLGEWAWDEEEKVCLLKNVGGLKREIEPLEDVILAYAHQSDLLENRYGNISVARKGLLELKAQGKKSKRQIESSPCHNKD